MSHSILLESSESQLKNARFSPVDGLTAHSLLIDAARTSRPREGSLQACILRALSDRSVGALKTMTDGRSTFAPSFVIPEDIDGPDRADASSGIADADPSSLERLLTRVYGPAVPERWSRTLERPSAWLSDIAEAHRSTADIMTGLRRRDRVAHAVQQLRYELAMSSPVGLSAFLVSHPPFRHVERGVAMPWAHDLTLTFSRRLTFGTVSAPRGAMIVLRDDGARQDADATVTVGIRSEATGASQGRLRQSRIQILLGAARASILLAVDVPQTMGALAGTLNYAPSTISYHTRILASAELIRIRRRGGHLWVSRSLRGEMLIETLC